MIGCPVQVNSFGSLAQAVVVFLLLPGLAALRGINFTELPQYLTEGAHHKLLFPDGALVTNCGKAMPVNSGQPKTELLRGAWQSFQVSPWTPIITALSELSQQDCFLAVCSLSAHCKWLLRCSSAPWAVHDHAGQSAQAHL